MTLKELNKTTRKFGNQAAIDYQNAHAGMSEELARRAPLEELRASFEAAKVFDSIPEHASFKPFRLGWRGAYTITHGSNSGYSQGCRCDRCKEAWRVYQKGRYKKRREALLTIRAAEHDRPYIEGTRAIMERAQQITLQTALASWIDDMKLWAVSHCRTCKCVDSEAAKLRQDMEQLKMRLAELGEKI